LEEFDDFMTVPLKLTTTTLASSLQLEWETGNQPFQSTRYLWFSLLKFKILCCKVPIYIATYRARMILRHERATTWYARPLLSFYRSKKVCLGAWIKNVWLVQVTNKNIIKALHYIFWQEYKLGRLHQRR
jgi:hypothetical protein